MAHTIWMHPPGDLKPQAVSSIDEWGLLSMGWCPAKPPAPTPEKKQAAESLVGKAVLEECSARQLVSQAIAEAPVQPPQSQEEQQPEKNDGMGRRSARNRRGPKPVGESDAGPGQGGNQPFR